MCKRSSRGRMFGIMHSKRKQMENMPLKRQKREKCKKNRYINMKKKEKKKNREQVFAIIS
jgi:hypothetical protein